MNGHVLLRCERIFANPPNEVTRIFVVQITTKFCGCLRMCGKGILAEMGNDADSRFCIKGDLHDDATTSWSTT